MDYIFLCLALAFASSSSILGGFYSRKNSDCSCAASLYNFLTLASAFTLWLIAFLTDMSFEVGVFIYAVLFAGFYTLCMIGLINALKTGPVSLTSLILQLSLIAVTVWGFIFWDESITPAVVMGLFFIAVSLWLCLYSRKNSEEKINKKWILFVLMAFIGNAGCSIVQRTQQTVYKGEHGKMLMVLAVAFSVIVCMVIFLLSDKKGAKTAIKRSWYLPVLSGSGNALLNLLVMRLAISSLSPTLIYPVLAIGALCISMLFSLLIFKEKLTWQQWVGIAVGTAGIGILSV